MDSKTLSAVALIVALVALGVAAFSLWQVQDASQKVDNLIESLQDEQLGFGDLLQDDGSIDEDELEQLFEQQPSPEDFEEFEDEDLDDEFEAEEDDQ